MTKRLALVILMLATAAWAVAAEVSVERAATSVPTEKLSADAGGASTAATVLKVLEQLGFQPDPSDEDDESGITTYSVDRRMLTRVGMRLHLKKMTVDRDGTLVIEREPQ